MQSGFRLDRGTFIKNGLVCQFNILIKFTADKTANQEYLICNLKSGWQSCEEIIIANTNPTIGLVNLSGSLRITPWAAITNGSGVWIRGIYLLK